MALGEGRRSRVLCEKPGSFPPSEHTCRNNNKDEVSGAQPECGQWKKLWLTEGIHEQSRFSSIHVHDLFSVVQVHGCHPWGKIVTLGENRRKLHEEPPSQDSWPSVGMCLELSGNYPRSKEIPGGSPQCVGADRIAYSVP